ncbi:MAG: hypothetical protein E7525_05875, partial [Ruminococcaceae bacterium]|nr:hypothetical protein [Oscillospiraceae bacterium]
MKRTLERMWRSGITMLLVLCMVVGLMTPAAFAAQVSDVNDDNVINYVSLGASNVNGYGMRGYLDEEVYDYPLKKNEVNIYGYKQNTPGSYPVLIADALGANLSQLAISSMRAEEVRFLLDDSYTGDAYTDWRFCDVPGYTNRNSQNWFYLAGKLEWEARGYAGTPTVEQAVATLKDAYREAIAAADVITVDIGVNNFGVYASNQIVSNMYENDLAKINPEWAAAFEEGKLYVMSVLQQYASEALENIPVEMLNDMVDTMAYALVGFCLSFDSVMAQIEALNPDATVVVVSIQNLMYGLNAQLPGIDVELPFGDIFGALINAANAYTATLSPYSDRGFYADVRENGHVEFFSDELLGYNGDPATLSQDVKDCFDVYDNDLYIKTRVQQFFVSALAGEPAYAPYVIITPVQANNLEAFYIGTLDGSIKIAGYPVIEFLAMGKAGVLPVAMAPVYALYDKALTTAYDVMAEIMQAGLEKTTLDATSFGQSFGPVEDALLGAFFDVLADAVAASVNDPSYSFDLDAVYPDGIFETLAAQAGLPEGFVNTVAIMGIRTGIGNSFFGHPNGNGHVELKDKILAAIENGTTGKDVAIEELKLALETAYAFVLEYYDEAYAYAYGYAEQNGYIAEAVAAIDELIVALKDIESVPG